MSTLYKYYFILQIRIAWFPRRKTNIFTIKNIAFVLDCTKGTSRKPCLYSVISTNWTVLLQGMLNKGLPTEHGVMHAWCRVSTVLVLDCQRVKITNKQFRMKIFCWFIINAIAVFLAITDIVSSKNSLIN